MKRNINNKDVVLVFDVGTQGARCMIIDDNGNMLGKHKISYEKPYYSKELEWAEQDPDFYYYKICECSMALKERIPDVFQNIRAISISTIRDTIVCVDRKGRALRPAILWLDKRMAKGAPKINPVNRIAVKAVGMEKEMDLQFKKSHCNWIMENEPEIWDRTYKCLYLSGYLTFKMTGNMVDAVASMVGRLPFDYKKRTYLSSRALTYPVFPVCKDKLPSLYETGEVMGEITEKMSKDSGIKEGLPVIATGSDKACELLGLGCIDESRAAVSLGTQATLSFTTKKYMEIQRFIPPFDSLVPGYYNPEYEIYRGYWLISWFKREFGKHEELIAKSKGISVEEILDETLSQIPPGCEGLIFQPYFTPNMTMPNARGGIFGFSDVHTRHHIYRAIVEGINYALMDGLKVMKEKLGKPFKFIALGGGGSQSDEICQITADMYGIPTVRTSNYEAAGIGGAIVAFVSIGRFKDYKEAVEAIVHDERIFYPNKELTRFYHKIYNKVYGKIFNHMKPLYKTLNEVHKDMSKHRG